MKNVLEMLGHMPEVLGGISTKLATSKARAAIDKAEGETGI